MFSSVRSGCVEISSFGGRCTGVWFTDSYSVGSVKTGVAESEVGEGWSASIVFLGSYGVETISCPFSAGVIEISSSVVVRVRGRITSWGVVWELETVDSVVPSNWRGGRTEGVGSLISCTEGWWGSLGRRPLFSFDCTPVLMSVRGRVVVGGWAESIGRVFVSHVLASETSG